MNKDIERKKREAMADQTSLRENISKTYDM